MLQVARLASRPLAEAAPRLVEFLTRELGSEGGARNRGGRTDLYYTAFALDGLCALRSEPPRAAVERYLAGFGDGDGLDLVHQACLVRCWAALGAGFPSTAFVAQRAAAMEAVRSADGGYGLEPGQADGSLYGAFLALGLLGDLGRPIPAPERLAASIARLRTADGGYANALDLPLGTTPSTAAAASVLGELGQRVPDGVAAWLLARLHPSGGFLATPDAPIPDLLSTATALHALALLGEPLDPLRERCLDFVDTLWTGRAFVGTWDDEECDSEYVFYALLALGHLAT